jgi:hypothetical protein
VPVWFSPSENGFISVFQTIQNTRKENTVVRGENPETGRRKIKQSFDVYSKCLRLQEKDNTSPPKNV